MKTFKQLTESLLEAAEKIDFAQAGIGMTSHTMTKSETVNGMTIAILKKGPANFVVVAEKGKKIAGGKPGEGIARTAEGGPRIATKMFKAAVEAAKSESDVTAIAKAGQAAATGR